MVTLQLKFSDSMVFDFYRYGKGKIVLAKDRRLRFVNPYFLNSDFPSLKDFVLQRYNFDFLEKKSLAMPEHYLPKTLLPFVRGQINMLTSFPIMCLNCNMSMELYLFCFDSHDKIFVYQQLNKNIFKLLDIVRPKRPFIEVCNCTQLNICFVNNVDVINISRSYFHDSLLKAWHDSQYIFNFKDLGLVSFSEYKRALKFIHPYLNYRSISVICANNKYYTERLYQEFNERFMFAGLFQGNQLNYDVVDQLLLMAGIEPNPGPTFEEELHSFTETMASLCNDELGDIITSFHVFLEQVVDKLPHVCRHTLRVVLRVFMLSTSENYTNLAAQVADLVLANDSHILLDSASTLLLGKCITLIYRYISKQIYGLKSDTTFDEDVHSFGLLELSESHIGAMICALGASIASILVIGKLPQAKQLDVFVNRCHSIPRAFKSVSEVFSYFEKCFKSYLHDGSLPFSGKLTASIDKEFDNFIIEMEALLSEINKDESMLDTRLCRKVKDLYESHMSLIKLSLDTKNVEISRKLQVYSPILTSMYNRAIKAPGSGVQFRQEPCAVSLVGDAGIGKTRLAQVIAMHCYKACGVTKEDLDKHDESSFTYSKLVGQKYWTNYNSTKHAVTILDDANQVQLNYIEGTPFPCQFINLKNSAACPLEVAECDLKKLAYFNSRLMLVTDNIASPPISQVINDAEAYHRRFDYKVVCKKISQDKDMLKFTHLRFDVSVRNLEHNDFDQLYNLTLEEMVPLLIGRISYYADLYNKNASSNQTILSQYYNESHSGLYGFEEYKPQLPDIFTLNYLLNGIPFRIRLRLYIYYLWLFYVCRQGYYVSVTRVLRSATRVTYFQAMKGFITNLWYRHRLLTITTFLCALSFLAGICKLYFFARKSYESQAHSYSGRSRNKGAAKIKVSQRTLKSVPHTLTSDPPMSETVKNYECELTKAQKPIYMVDTNLEEMIVKISQNVYLIDVKTHNGRHKNHITMLKGKIGLTNWHFIEILREHIDAGDIVSCIMKRPVNGTYLTFNLDPELIVNSSRVWTDKQSFVDAALVCVGIKVPNHKDISKYLMTTQNLTNLSSGYMKRVAIHPTLESQVMNTGALLYQYDPVFTYPWNIEGENVSVWPKNVLYFQADSLEGMCGSPIMVVDPTHSRKIIGFSMAYNKSFGASVACHLPPEVVKEYESQLENIVGLYDATLARISVEDCEMHSLELKIMEGEQSLPVGKYKHTAVIQTNSAISPSICFDEITPHISKPAKLKNFELDGCEVNVFKKAISKNLNTSVKISKEHLDVAKHHIDYLFSKVVDEKPFTLTWEQVIKGGIPGLQPIPRSTSPGAPYVYQSRLKPGKQQFLGSDENYIMNDEFLMQQLRNFSVKCESLERSIEPYTVQLKDETRDFERVRLGKTRSFMACNLTMTCKIREYFGFYFAKTHLNGKLCGLLPGFNPHGADSDFVFRYITQLRSASDTAFGAGDFSNFDGTLNEEILNLIIQKWIENLDLTPDQHREAIVCGLNIMNAIYLISDHLYMNTHSLPSGCPATTILNSWYNSVICAITMYEAVKKRGLNESHYRDYYRLLVYGDDNLFSLAYQLCDSEISSDITHSMAQLGMTYTSGTKDGNISFVSLWETEILKRSFTFNSVLARYIMPLRLSVILESLNWDRKKNYQDKIQQFVQNFDFVIRELSLYDDKTFNLYCKRIYDFANKNGIDLPYYTHKSALRLLDIEM